MGTKVELLQRVASEGKARGISIEVKGIGIAIDREQTSAVYDESGLVVPGRRGENAIGTFVSETGIPVYAVAGIREVVNYLFEEQVPVLIGGKWIPLDEAALAEFNEYIRTYCT
jgi:orotate phosphoribosyltransferase